MLHSVKEYETASDPCREDLFNNNLSLVKKIAHHASVRLPPGKSVEDLIQVGMIGLLEASRTYQPQEGAEFQTYARIRVRGAIIDELRRESWMPRSLQTKAQELSKAIHSVENKLGRSATGREVAVELEITIEEYNQLLESVAGTTVFSIEDEGTLGNPEDNEDIPFQNIQDLATKNRLAEVIASLPEKEKLVVVLYYDKGLNYREIGKVLNIGESRVCQIHTQAVGRMRSRMKEFADD